MMGGQVQIPEDTNTGLHILDDDSNWRIFQREMKITLQEFYEYAEMSRVFQADGEIKDGWAALMFFSFRVDGAALSSDARLRR